MKPMAGPRATALRVTWLYISPDKTAQKVDRVQVGREMVVAEKSGPWMRVYANTDIEEEHTSDQPIFGASETPPPISGWMEAKGVVVEDTPNGDRYLMGAAANQEAEANDPRGPANAARSAHLLYRRLAEMFPNSPLAPEAAWRAADILWQIQKSDFGALPSAKERDPYMRNQMDEDNLKKVVKLYPHTRQADLADYDLIDNKLCGDWQGSTKCPEKEVGNLREVRGRASRQPARCKGALRSRLSPGGAGGHVWRRRQRQEAGRSAQSCARPGGEVEGQVSPVGLHVAGGGSGVQTGSGRTRLRHRPRLNAAEVYAAAKAIESCTPEAF